MANECESVLVADGESAGLLQQNLCESTLWLMPATVMNFLVIQSSLKAKYSIFKGTVKRDFRPLFFSSNEHTWITE